MKRKENCLKRMDSTAKVLDDYNIKKLEDFPNLG